jgi:FolB domain-containing protein
MNDCLSVSDLELWTRIGVSETERAHEQCVLASFSLVLNEAMTNDDVPEGFDYALLSAGIRKLGQRERKTIERLAEDIAQYLLEESSAPQVRVCVRKFPPIGAKEVKVEIERTR